MTRHTKPDIFMTVAFVLSRLSTCSRRAVGCVLTDKHHHIIGTGYNGSPKGMSHCIDNPCPGANYPSGEGLDKCQAIHAEQNALLQCPNTMSIKAAYITTPPCVHCVKLLLNTSCEVIYTTGDYPMKDESKHLWAYEGGRQWIEI